MPTWGNDPASPRQLKLLRFFTVPIDAKITKAEANRHICRIFHTPALIERWNKYKFLTGDDDRDNPELMPFDPAELDRLVLPPDWAEQLNTAARKKLEAQWRAAAANTDNDDQPSGVAFIVSLDDDDENDQSPIVDFEPPK